MAVTTLAGRLRTAAWLGWQIESNWADPLVFAIYSVARPLAAALILMGIYWAVTGGHLQRDAFLLFYIGNAFHEYVLRLVVGMGWVVVEEREEYETLKYVYASPIGIFTYLWGRSSVKFAQATLSVVLMFLMGWFVLGLRWDLGVVRWGAFLLAFGIGLVAVVYLGFLVAGLALLLPRAAMTMNEGLAVALYLLCGVIYPIDLLPRGLQELTLLLPFTYWYEALRRFLIGHGASERLSALSDGQLLGALIVATLVFAVASHFGYLALERRARKLGRLDQTTLF